MTDTLAKDESLSQEADSHEADSSSTDEQAQDFSDKQKAFMKEYMDKQIQSTTDKRFQQTKNELSGITQTLQKVADVQSQYGVTQEQAVKIIERDEKIDAVLAQGGGHQASDGSGADVSELAQSILSGAGIDVNDDAARAFLNTLTGESSAGVATKLTTWALERAKKPHATPGDIIAPGGNVKAVPEMVKLDTELERLQGLPRTADNMAARKKVLQEMTQYD